MNLTSTELKDYSAILFSLIAIIFSAIALWKSFKQQKKENKTEAAKAHLIIEQILYLSMQFKVVTPKDLINENISCDKLLMEKINSIITGNNMLLLSVYNDLDKTINNIGFINSKIININDFSQNNLVDTMWLVKNWIEYYTCFLTLARKRLYGSWIYSNDNRDIEQLTDEYFEEMKLRLLSFMSFGWSNNSKARNLEHNEKIKCKFEV